MKPATLGMLALFGTAVLWGSNHVVARASNGVVPLAAYIFWRWSLAVPVMLVIAWPSIRRHRATIRAEIGDLCLIGTLGVGVFSGLLVAGAYFSRAVEVSMINATTPAWVALLALISGQGRLAGVQWLGLGLAMTGTLVILSRGDPAVLAGVEARAGNLFALAAAILFAWFSLRLRRYSGRLPAFALTTVTAAIGTVLVSVPFFLVSVLVFGSGIVAEAPQDTGMAVLILVYAAVGPTLLGNAFYIYGLSVIGPQRAAAFLYLAPVASSVLAVMFLDEPLHVHHFAGYALILGGLFMVNHRGARPAASAPGP